MSNRLTRQEHERSEHKSEMESRHGLVGHPKADRLYQLAWDMGHSAGYGEIETFYDEMADLLKPNPTNQQTGNPT